MEMLYNFEKCLNELVDADSFELQSHTHSSGQTDYYIPYMMNDALECYFILENAQKRYELCPDNQGSTLTAVCLAYSDAEPTEELDTELFLKTVSNILLNPDGSILLRLVSGKTI